MLLKILILFCVSSEAQAVDTKLLSEKVIKLRQEVELLNDEYKTEREKVLNKMKALSIQNAELSSNIRNEQLRKEQLQEKIGQLKKEMDENSVESGELELILTETIGKLRSYIETSLPFKKQERIESVNKLSERLLKKEVSVTKGANLLWAMIEDERRLAGETSLHKQTIPMNGKMQLAEVIKVGMLFLYFKTEAGEVGLAQKKQGQWVYKTFHDQKKEEQTLAFMDSLKKQIRQGYFEIPTQR